MNREELKKTLKPLIKQCIKEVLLEESGVLSNIVSEVAHGLSGGGTIVESKSRRSEAVEEQIQQQELAEESRRKMAETRRKLADSIGAGAYGGVDLFEGTEPLSGGGAAQAPSPSGDSMGPMANISPNDSGVDLNNIPGLNLSVVKKLAGQ